LASHKGVSVIHNKLVKNAVWNSVGTLIYFACQWLITIFVVILFPGYTEAGILALAMSITNALVTVANYNIRAFQVSDIDDEFVNGTYIAARVVTCLISIILCTVFVTVVGYDSVTSIIILIYMIFRTVEAFVDVYHGINQKQWKMDYIGISFIVRGLLSLISFILFGWLFGLVVAAISMVISSAIVVVLFDYRMSRKLTSLAPLFNKSAIVLLKRCFPLMLTIFISVLMVSYSRLAIERIHGVDALGAFTAAVTPSVFIGLLASFIYTPLINLFAESFRDGNTKKFAILVGICSLLNIGVVGVIYVGAALLGEWGLVLVFGESIRSYVYLLYGAIIASGFTSFMWLMNMFFSVTRDIRGIFYGNIIRILICIVVIDWLLRDYGLSGANYAIIIAQGVAVVFLFGRLWWFLKGCI